MTNYITDIRIDTHGKRTGRATDIRELNSGQFILNVERIEIVIAQAEPIVAKLTLWDIPEGEERVLNHDAICPEVELAPMLALVEQVIGNGWEMNGESWQYTDKDHLTVTFTRRKE